MVLIDQICNVFLNEPFFVDLKKKKIIVTGKGNKLRSPHINRELNDILCQYFAVRDQFYKSWFLRFLSTNHPVGGKINQGKI